MKKSVLSFEEKTFVNTLVNICSISPIKIDAVFPKRSQNTDKQRHVDNTIVCTCI